MKNLTFQAAMLLLQVTILILKPSMWSAFWCGISVMAVLIAAVILIREREENEANQ